MQFTAILERGQTVKKFSRGNDLKSQNFHSPQRDFWTLFFSSPQNPHGIKKTSAMHFAFKWKTLLCQICGRKIFLPSRHEMKYGKHDCRPRTAIFLINCAIYFKVHSQSKSLKPNNNSSFTIFHDSLPP